MKKYLTSKNLALLLINLVPLYGVLFLDWQAMIIILFYVAETILVGILQVFKMAALYIMNHNNPAALVVIRTNTGVKGLGLIPFFIFHFGFFVFVQMMIFGGFTNQNLIQSFGLLFTGDYKYAMAIIFITKLSLLISDLFWNPEIETQLPDDVFFEPYPRIFVQQFMVILGGWGIFFGQGMMGYLIVLIGCKIVLDLILANISKNWIKDMANAGKGAYRRDEVDTEKK
ncbi:MAG: DUF6498-containing protein [Bacteroidia bacterium]